MIITILVVLSCSILNTFLQKRIPNKYKINICFNPKFKGKEKEIYKIFISPHQWKHIYYIDEWVITQNNLLKDYSYVIPFLINIFNLKYELNNSIPIGEVTNVCLSNKDIKTLYSDRMNMRDKRKQANSAKISKLLNDNIKEDMEILNESFNNNF